MKENKLAKFWMVKKDDEHCGTKKIHYAKEEATLEAERLCRQENCRYFVLESISHCEPQSPPAVWTVM